MRSKYDHKADVRKFSRGLLALAVLTVLLLSGGFLGAVGVNWPSHSWLSWFALIPLFVSIAVLRPARACLAGALWAGSFAASSAFLDAVPISLPSIGTLILLASVSIYTAVGARITRRIGFNPFILGLGWLAVEVVLDFSSPQGRGRLFTSVPSQHGLMGCVGHTLGYLFVALVVALANGLLLAVLGGIRLPFPARPRRTYVTERVSSIVEFVDRHYRVYLLASLQPRAPPGLLTA
ncbi:MAG: hypothetical protein AABZ47_00860 [Planctomycetota bacterium]